MAPAQKKQRLSNGTVAAVDAMENIQDESKPGETSPESPASKKAQQNRSLFVRSLPATTTTESLTALFSDSYPIKHATAVIDRDTKQCKGFGFVTFADPEDAQRAKEEFNGHLLEGKKLRIELAEARQRDKEKDAAAKSDNAVEVKKPKGRPEKELPQAQSRLIVRNLPWTIRTSEDLSKHFMSFGKVKQAYIPKRGGLMAGFGFVIMRGRKNAEKALEGVNGKEVDGRTLAVDWAVEKEAYENAIKDDEEDEEAEAEEGSDEDGVNVDEEDDEEGANEHLDGMSDYDENDEDDSDMDDEDVDMDDDEDDEEDGQHDDKPDEKSTTLFVRNLPFSCTDEDLEDHFTRFGSVRYARVVMDYATGRSKGTGFVCFYEKESADGCLRTAPQKSALSATEKSSAQPTNSILQNDMADPSGEHTLDGRVLQVSRAVEKREANRLTDEGLAHRNKRDKDKRRLYLLGEGTIPSNSKLWESLPPSERTMREASAKQRKTLIEGNPSLHMSLTRLSVRNIPRSINSKELKALAREAVVGFATDVKEGKRSKLSKEELARGGEEMQAAEKARKKSGKGLVKQTKVVFEGAGGSKISEETGAGRSRGYGFIEYHTHRSALMGLRWLNGHAVGYKVKEGGKGPSREEIQDRKKRLIVEFAIENAQVVLRRNDREVKARERSKAVSEGRAQALTEKKDNRGKFGKGGAKGGKDFKGKDGKPGLRKRKREDAVEPPKSTDDSKPTRVKLTVDEKTAKRNQIIGRKRAMRKARKGGK